MFVPEGHTFVLLGRLIACQLNLLHCVHARHVACFVRGSPIGAQHKPFVGFVLLLQRRWC